jgi:peptide-methionine (S)-S-oxide reductase
MANLETVIFGGGCFWCLEAVFDRLYGVTSVESGYMGGKISQPSYEQVCGGNTGHAEVVRVTFDPEQISHRDLLDVFFTVHDPTTLNRQGADVGTQYRSVVFYTSEEQRKQTEEAIATMDSAGIFERPIVTKLEPAGDFWVAEDYHQEYFDNNSNKPYCQFVIAPKLAKFEKKFGERTKRTA